jgi:hypothetical protein
MVGVAQLVEHLVVVQRVEGSSPFAHPKQRRRLARSSVALLVLSATVSGCASRQHAIHTSQHTPQSQLSTIVGYRWQITEVRHGTASVTVPRGRGGYVAFSPNGVLNADDGVNHYYGHFTPTANGYHVTDMAGTLVGYVGHDPVTLALTEGTQAITTQDSDVVIEGLTGDRLALSADGYHVAATRAAREPVQPTSVPPTNTHLVTGSSAAYPLGKREGRLGQDQRCGAEHFGAVAENARGDMHVRGCARDAVPVDAGTDRVEQHIAGGGELTTDDDELRVEDVHDPGDDHADGLAGVGDSPARPSVSGGDEIE